ncbi:hypothetical protein F4779DRAFT_635265 [Xylariaceae sp. FL0662B]|nr:hypothetical protein F4779DRAFT_635265 [Xylariaceae sp. FL0662B]
MPAPLTPEQQATFNDNRVPTIIAVSSLFIAFTTIAVSLRFASRYSRRAAFGPDDWLSVAALIFVISFIVTVILSVDRGMGKHVWAVDPAGAWRIVQIGYINSLINPLARGCVKLALLFLYRRVFTMNVKWFRYTWWVLFCYVIGHSTAGLFGGAFQCLPSSYFWERLNPSLVPPAKGFCGINTTALVVASSALTILVGVALFIVPIIMVSQLQLKRPQKIGLVLVFSSGALAIGAEVTRLRFATTASQLGADTTWITADIYLWAAIENSVGLICACMPTFGSIVAGAKHVVSYISEISLLRTSNSLPKASSGRSGTLLTIGRIHRRPIKGNTSMTSLRSATSMNQDGILRTDEFCMQKYPRTDSLSLNNYHDPTKPTGHGSAV